MFAAQLNEVGIWTGMSEADVASAPQGWALVDELPVLTDDERALAQAGAWQIISAEEAEERLVQHLAGPLCIEIDAAWNAWLEEDKPYDFGQTVAIDDAGVSYTAGVRKLQMKPKDRTNWNDHGRVCLTLVTAGLGDQVAPIKCEDNVWVQTTATQALAVFLTITATGSYMLAQIGKLKHRARNATRMWELDDIRTALAGDWMAI